MSAHDRQDRPAAPTALLAGEGARAADSDWPEHIYDLNQAYQARLHRNHADRHLEAARLLEVYEFGECGAFRAEARVVCPLWGPVVRTEEIPSGIRLHLHQSVSAEALLQHMRCHHAFARAHGLIGMESCPLYVSGIRITLASDEAIDVTSEDAATVEEIRHRARSHQALRPSVEPP